MRKLIALLLLLPTATFPVPRLVLPSMGGTPAGTNTMVQFNDSGVFGGDAAFTYDKVTITLSAPYVSAANGVTGGSLTSTGGGIYMSNPATAMSLYSYADPAQTTYGTSFSANNPWHTAAGPQFVFSDDNNYYLTLRPDADYNAVIANPYAGGNIVLNSAVTFGNVINGSPITVNNISTSNPASAGNFLRGDGSWAAAGGSPAGTNTMVQFNDGGAFGGENGLRFDKTTSTLTVADPQGDINGTSKLTSNTLTALHVYGVYDIRPASYLNPLNLVGLMGGAGFYDPTTHAGSISFDFNSENDFGNMINGAHSRWTNRYGTEYMTLFGGAGLQLAGISRSSNGFMIGPPAVYNYSTGWAGTESFAILPSGADTNIAATGNVIFTTPVAHTNTLEFGSGGVSVLQRTATQPGLKFASSPNSDNQPYSGFSFDLENSNNGAYHTLWNSTYGTIMSLDWAGRLSTATQVSSSQMTATNFNVDGFVYLRGNAPISSVNNTPVNLITSSTSDGYIFDSYNAFGPGDFVTFKNHGSKIAGIDYLGVVHTPGVTADAGDLTLSAAAGNVVLNSPVTFGNVINGAPIQISNIATSNAASAGNFLRGDGTWSTVTAGAAGTNTLLQFNDEGALGGATSVAYDKVADQLKSTKGIWNAAGTHGFDLSGSTGYPLQFSINNITYGYMTVDGDLRSALRVGTTGGAYIEDTLLRFPGYGVIRTSGGMMSFASNPYYYSDRTAYTFDTEMNSQPTALPYMSLNNLSVPFFGVWRDAGSNTKLAASAGNLILEGTPDINLNSPVTFNNVINGAPITVSNISTSNVASAGNYLRGDGSWSAPPGTYTLPAAAANTLGGVKGTGAALVCSGTNKVTGFAADGTLQCGTDQTGGGGGNAVQATVDFGAVTAMGSVARVTVAAAWVTAGSIIVCGLDLTTGTADHPAGEEDPLIEMMVVAPAARVAGVSFDVIVHAPESTWGTYVVNCTGV